MRTFRLLIGTEFLARCDNETRAAQIAKTYSLAYKCTVTVEEYVPRFHYNAGLRQAIDRAAEFEAASPPIPNEERSW